MRKYKGARSIKSSSRKRSLGKVKINYNSLVNKEVKNYLSVQVQNKSDRIENIIQ